MNTVIINSLYGVAILNVILAAYAWQRRQEPVAIPLWQICIACAGWAWTYGADLASPSVTEKIWLMQLRITFIAFIPVYIFSLTQEFLELPQSFTRWQRNSLYIVPVVAIGLNWTWQTHQLFRYNFYLKTVGGLTLLAWDSGIYFGVYLLYNLSLIAYCLWVLGRSLRTSSKWQQTLLLIGAIVIPTISDTAYNLGYSPVAGLNFAPHLLFLSNLALGYIVFNYRLLDLTPIARDKVINSMNDGMIVLDKQNHVLDLNPIAIRAINLPVAQIRGKDVTKLIPVAETLFATPPEQELRTEFHIDSPAARDYEILLSPITERDRTTIIGRLLIFRDITKRKYAENALRNSEQMFRSFLEISPNPVIVTDEAGYIVFASQQSSQLLQYTVAELLQLKIEALVPDEARPKHIALRQNYQAQPSLRPMRTEADIYIRRKDGELIPVEISLSPLHMPTGGQLVLSIIRDITENKKNELAIRESEKRLRSFFETAPIAVLIVNARGEIVFANTQSTKLFQYTIEELQHVNVESLIPDSYRTRHVSLRQNYQQKPHVRLIGEQQLLALRKDGSEFRAEISLSPLEGADSSLTICVISDITRRHEVEELRTNLIHTMVHDLRNPLASIINAIDILRDPTLGDLPDEEREYMFKATKDNAQKMISLVNAILDVHKLENAEMPLYKTGVSLFALATDAILTQIPNAKQKHVQLHNEIDPHLPWIGADAQLLARVLQNLIHNALKFTPAAGHIYLTAEKQADGFYCFSVRDTGSGIDDDVRERLFQKFATTKRGGHGTGLGLTFCKLVIEAHGGKIWAESKKGNGTTISFTLPSMM